MTVCDLNAACTQWRAYAESIERMNTILWVVLIAFVSGGVLYWGRRSRGKEIVPTIGVLPKFNACEHHDELRQLRVRLILERHRRRAVEREYDRLLQVTDAVLFLGPHPADADTEDI